MNLALTFWNSFLYTNLKKKEYKIDIQILEYIIVKI